MKKNRNIKNIIGAGPAWKCFVWTVFLAVFCVSVSSRVVLADGTYQNQQIIPGSSGATTSFVDYLKQVIGLGYATIGIFAMFMLAIGAYQYLMAAGNLAKAENAKETVSSALLGLVLGLLSWVILNTINPDLVSLKGLGTLNSVTFQYESKNTGTVTSSGNITNYTPVASSADVKAKIAQYDSIIQAAHEKYPNVSVALIKALIDQESGGNPNAVSPVGAVGLMQLSKDWSHVNRADPYTNVMTATGFMSGLLKKYDLPLALAAYNAGPGNVNKYGGIPPFKETQEFVPKVIGKMKNY